MSGTRFITTDASFIRGETTACESPMPTTTVRPDSLANLTRQAILIQGAAFPVAQIEDREVDARSKHETIRSG